ncbi:double-strand break repair helicase AddA [Frigidibacter sp. RF13]|uniref:double-strand break repair helicase AddA n=1 Tax=Frigidibacter sp. RF13 TaxID=2997340 RepID=UPI00226DF34B|nr:double-strand break repair helicase AddA [Frigidibacter sp. RF13]MCY1126634.1 double-strand break repair helicase AddA [Frigidibacter sp. RF13]
MTHDEASRAQARAADPLRSVWLAANAGSGKTRVLTDRVARLLLGGTEPQRILCLTYTKAAASEMQNRLFRRLGRWAMLEEGALRGELAELGVEGEITPEVLAGARRLFARAIETPGGLKIQTIHAFCAGLLRRFPLEARVSPDFTELDDRTAGLMRREIVEEMAEEDTESAVAALASLVQGDDLAALLTEICGNRDAFSRQETRESLGQALGLPPGLDARALLSDVFLGGEGPLLAALRPLLAASSVNDVKLGRALADLAFDPPTIGTLIELEAHFLTGAKAKVPFGAKIGSVPTKAVAQGAGAALMPALEALMLRVEAARALRVGLAAVERSLALHAFARPFLGRYAARKAARGALDFDDLIARAAALLSDRSVAAWVLYRLDGGIDHILVDEAQDTSPGQWRVIERLAEEFTAGEGARGEGRRIFVVGDKKQSIYSFQGADLATFDAMAEEFESRHQGAVAPFESLSLRHSFRSSRAILDVVDHTFKAAAGRGLGGETRHIAFHAAMPGRVDLWEPVEKPGEPEEGDWSDPVDQLADSHESVVLARKVAGEIRRMIDEGTAIETREGSRALDEGDVLILVRRRGPLFHELVRACKAAGLEVAGADRLTLGDQLAVKDILALLSFLALPEDDLSLAAALRSPLFGWSEDALYRLAQPRAKGSYLWQALRSRDGAEAEAARAVIADLRDQADFLRPYELIERLLTRHDGRRKLLARLGVEAEDAIDALLAEALTYEQASVPSLTGFLVWMQSGDVEVKRRHDGTARAIRVMTVHGAKGLEAPLVILPDTAKWAPRERGSVMASKDGAFWRMADDAKPPLLASLAGSRRAAEREEWMRLLYVAMTRAESWLIVCAAGDVGKSDESWYRLVEAGMDHAGAASLPPEGELWPFGHGMRYDWGRWPEPVAAARRGAPGPADLPDWALRAAPTGLEPERALLPSALPGPKALPGEAGLDQEMAKRLGTALHLLLEHLPGAAETGRERIARRLLGPLSAETETVFRRATALLTDPALAALVGPGSLAEVELAARVPALDGRLMAGTVDRLIVTPDRVVAVDFKSNRMVPARAEDIPSGILAQLGAYAAMLAAIYPDREIEVAVLWTETAELMLVPLNIVRNAFETATLP